MIDIFLEYHMWLVYSLRRRRIRWIALIFLVILLCWIYLLYESFHLRIEPDSSHQHKHHQLISSTRSSFLIDIDNHPLFLNRTPVRLNYHIFYYPWYGNPEFDHGRFYHWNHRRLAHWDRDKAAHYPQHRHEPPDDIGSNFYPLLGPYSSRSPTIVDRHMKMIRLSGAGTLTISWYPPGMADDEGYPWDDLIPMILDKADKYQLKVNFHIEPYRNRTATNVIHWTNYILRQYGSHPAFYRYQGKGFFYIYDSYQIPVEHWREQFISNPTNKNNAFFVGLILKSSDCSTLKSSGFDAAYSYFAADGFTEASTSNRWRSIIQQCSPLPFIPSIGPGYIDTNIRPWNGQTTRLRNNGQYYRDRFRDLPWSRTSDEHLVSLTSFNEWGEGTQIEPAADTNPNKMITYESYHQGPLTYIDLTRELLFSSSP